MAIELTFQICNPWTELLHSLVKAVYEEEEHFQVLPISKLTFCTT